MNSCSPSSPTPPRSTYNSDDGAAKCSIWPFGSNQAGIDKGRNTGRINELAKKTINGNVDRSNFSSNRDMGQIDPVRKPESIGFLKRMLAWLFGSNLLFPASYTDHTTYRLGDFDKLLQKNDEGHKDAVLEHFFPASAVGNGPDLVSVKTAVVEKMKTDLFRIEPLVINSEGNRIEMAGKGTASEDPEEQAAIVDQVCTGIRSLFAPTDSDDSLELNALKAMYLTTQGIQGFLGPELCECTKPEHPRASELVFQNQNVEKRFQVEISKENQQVIVKVAMLSQWFDPGLGEIAPNSKARVEVCVTFPLDGTPAQLSLTVRKPPKSEEDRSNVEARLLPKGRAASKSNQLPLGFGAGYIRF